MEHIFLLHGVNLSQAMEWALETQEEVGELARDTEKNLEREMQLLAQALAPGGPRPTPPHQLVQTSDSCPPDPSVIPDEDMESAFPSSTGVLSVFYFWQSQAVAGDLKISGTQRLTPGTTGRGTRF